MGMELEKNRIYWRESRDESGLILHWNIIGVKSKLIIKGERRIQFDSLLDVENAQSQIIKKYVMEGLLLTGIYQQHRAQNYSIINLRAYITAVLSSYQIPIDDFYRAVKTEKHYNSIRRWMIEPPNKTTIDRVALLADGLARVQGRGKKSAKTYYYDMIAILHEQVKK